MSNFEQRTETTIERLALIHDEVSGRVFSVRCANVVAAFYEPEIGGIQVLLRAGDGKDTLSIPVTDKDKALEWCAALLGIDENDA